MHARRERERGTPRREGGQRSVHSRAHPDNVIILYRAIGEDTGEAESPAEVHPLSTGVRSGGSVLPRTADVFTNRPRESIRLAAVHRTPRTIFSLLSLSHARAPLTSFRNCIPGREQLFRKWKKWNRIGGRHNRAARRSEWI